MSKLVWVMVACVAVALWPTHASAAFTAGQEQAAQALIQDFTSKEFAARQQAVDKLIALGPDVLPVIQKTLAQTQDAEVKLRCQMVLKGVADKYGVTVTGPKPAAPALAVPKPLGKLTADASKITLDVRDGTLGEVLKDFARQSGNTPLNLPNDLAEKNVTLNVKDMPYWQALDKLCEAVGAFYQVNFLGGTGGLALSPLANYKDLGAFTGPVSVKIVNAANSLTFRPLGVGKPRMGSLQYEFAFFWEDRMPVVFSEGFVTKATLPDGREFFQPGWPNAVLTSRTVAAVPGRNAPSGNLSFQTANFPGRVDKLASLEGIVRLSASVGPDKELKVDDVLGEDEKTAEKDGLMLFVTPVNKRMRGQADLVMLNIRATRDGNPVDPPVLQQDPKYGVFLIEPAGNRHQAQRFASSATGASLWAAEPDGKPVRIEFQQPAAMGQPGHNPSVTLTFFDLPVIDGKWSLLVVYPGDTETKEYPFKIENVPVP
jgi:hypothetical protein